LAEIIIFVLSIVLSTSSVYIFQENTCEVTLPPGAGAPLYCEKSGFPIKILTGGYAESTGQNEVAFIANSIFYFVLLNLGYLAFKKLRTLSSK